MNRAIALLQQGQAKEAAALLMQALEFRQHDPDLHVNLAIAYEDLGLVEKAELGYRFVLSAWPENVEAASNLGNLLARTGRVDEAETLHRSALHRNPKDIYSLRALALVQVEQLKIEEALVNIRRAAELSNSPELWSEYLGYSLHVGYDGDAHQNWVDRFAEHRRYPAPDYGWDGVRQLRVGFIGNVFRLHACAYSLEPILEHSKVHSVIYSDVMRPDETTARMKKLASEWHDTFTMNHDHLAIMLRAHRLDAIVDLMGHKQGGRLLALARRPAATILTYIGYAADTRMTENIDAEVGWAYRPTAAPPVSPLPFDRNGYITFGSVHRPAKITTEVAAAWGKVIAQVSGARLRVVVAGGEANKSARKKLVDADIAADRLDLIERVPSRIEYLQLADDFDIHLDAFPYRGGATTFDMAWQGVPTESADTAPIVAADIHGLRAMRLTLRTHSDGRKVASRFDAALTSRVRVARGGCNDCKRKRSA